MAVDHLCLDRCGRKAPRSQRTYVHQAPNNVLPTVMRRHHFRFVANHCENGRGRVRNHMTRFVCGHGKGRCVIDLSQWSPRTWFGRFSIEFDRGGLSSLDDHCASTVVWTVEVPVSGGDASSPCSAMRHGLICACSYRSRNLRSFIVRWQTTVSWCRSFYTHA